MQHKADLVVIGAGQAAVTLVETLRRNGDTRSIVILGAEPFPPYQRPPLSKAYLSGDMARERLWLKPDDWYAANDITLQTGARVSRIDRATARVEVAGGAHIGYSKLVIATGSRPRPFPADQGGSLAGVHTIREIHDIDALVTALDRVKNAVVIGGGYIGLEAAAILRKLGHAVALVEAGPRILGRVACATTAQMIRDMHRAHGVTMFEDTGVKNLVPDADGHVAGVQLADGACLPADLVIVGIGGIANAELAQDCGLTCSPNGGGIHVNAFSQSSDPAIHAIGDVAALEFRGQRLRLESVQNACDQARALAQTLLGSSEPYAPVPWFWSDQFDMKLQIAGLNIGADRTVFRPGTRPGSGSVWYFRQEHLVAVDALSDPRAYMTGKRWLEQGVSPCPDQVGAPAAELKAAI